MLSRQLSFNSSLRVVRETMYKLEVALIIIQEKKRKEKEKRNLRICFSLSFISLISSFFLYINKYISKHLFTSPSYRP